VGLNLYWKQISSYRIIYIETSEVQDKFTRYDDWCITAKFKTFFAIQCKALISLLIYTVCL